MSDYEGRAGELRILLPEGIYDAQATRYKQCHYYTDTRCYLRFQITSFGEHLGKIIWGTYSLYECYKPNMDFYKAWRVAKGRLPRRNEKMIPDHLCGHIYRIRVRTVIKDKDGDPIPPFAQYSVAKIIALVQPTNNPLPNTHYRLPTSPSSRARKKRGKRK